ncbi:MAG TPA: rhomboid family intramembrane serine protease [Gemmatimonadaceae bacterium]|nr:rhomboid family intramembrane serine protease [Gemmatimonadaceae bacterium]
MSFPATTDQDYPRLTPAVQVLVAINVAILFLEATVLRASLVEPALGFSFAAAPLRPWTVVTYMFVHQGFWHLALNMYALLLFGPRLEHTWGTKKFTWFYLASGFGALVCYSLFFRDSGTLLMGASGAVFGVMGAYALQWPREEIYLFFVLPMRVLTLVLALVGLELAMGVFGLAGGGGTVAHFAHVGGFLVAWMYLRTPSAVSIEQLRQRISQVPDTEDPPRAIPRSLPRSRERVDDVDEIVAKSKAVAAKRPAATTPARKPGASEARPDEVNRVLDKISAHGLESLTKDERRVLEEMSRRLRDQ